MSKENPKKTFVLSDESVNCYGFRVLTDGISLEAFKENPVMLWNHTRSWNDREDTILPIGRWENLRAEGGKLLGDACFDMEDPFAAKIANKVEKGFIRGCSIGIEILERSESSEHVVNGQTRATVKRCKLNEVSITDIPANANAVSLYDANGNIIELTAESVECTNDSGFITSSELGEIDLTDYAKITDVEDGVQTAKSYTDTVAAGKLGVSAKAADSALLNGKTDTAFATAAQGAKADTALQSFTETDPTVPNWAKQPSKPTYTATEVGAMPNTAFIPTKTSDLTNNSGYITASDVGVGLPDIENPYDFLIVGLDGNPKWMRGYLEIDVLESISINSYAKKTVINYVGNGDLALSIDPTTTFADLQDMNIVIFNSKGSDLIVDANGVDEWKDGDNTFVIEAGKTKEISLMPYFVGEELRIRGIAG